PAPAPRRAWRDWPARPPRRGGRTPATPAAIGASRLSHCHTARRSAASSRIQAWKRRRARPRSVPSTYSAASLSCSSGLLRYLISIRPQACLQPLEPAPHPGLHRPERLTHVARELRVGEAVVERQHDRLALLHFQAAEAIGERLGVGAARQLIERSRGVARDRLDRILGGLM